uniref:TPT domain-containing protein n=1 Tax=Macrostomum lignano TaxID=282301 RepID=A0A1I8FPC0_9PLAT
QQSSQPQSSLSPAPSWASHGVLPAAARTSGSLMANLVLGVLILNKSYPLSKYASVLVITGRIVVCTIESASDARRPPADEAEAAAAASEQVELLRWCLGVLMLVFALFMSARMGIFQERRTASTAKHPGRSRYSTINHCLPLPGFLLLSADIWQHVRLFSESAPMWPLPVPKLWVWLAGNVLTNTCASGRVHSHYGVLIAHLPTDVLSLQSESPHVPLRSFLGGRSAPACSRLARLPSCGSTTLADAPASMPLTSKSAESLIRTSAAVPHAEHGLVGRPATAPCRPAPAGQAAMRKSVDGLPSWPSFVQPKSDLAHGDHPAVGVEFGIDTQPIAMQQSGPAGRCTAVRSGTGPTTLGDCRRSVAGALPSFRSATFSSST